MDGRVYLQERSNYAVVISLQTPRAFNHTEVSLIHMSYSLLVTTTLRMQAGKAAPTHLECSWSYGIAEGYRENHVLVL